MTYLLKNGFDPMKGERIKHGWTGILRALEDGEVHSWSEIVKTVSSETGLLPKTVSNLLHSGVSAGYFARSGNFFDHTRSIVQIKWED